MDNGFIESFNGRLRDGCLNMKWFESLSEAKRIIKRWRIVYNGKRPRSSLEDRAPAVYVSELLGVSANT